MKELIVAIDLNNAIGYNNQLLCSLPNDLKYFKDITLGKNVWMGRKTWDSLPMKPLPKRENTVFSKNNLDVDVNKIFANNLEYFFKNTKEDFIVIGGSQIYNAAINYVDTLYVTEIQHRFELVDTWFPYIDKSQWKEVSRKINLPDEKHKYEYHFIKYERIPTYYHIFSVYNYKGGELSCYTNLKYDNFLKHIEDHFDNFIDDFDAYVELSEEDQELYDNTVKIDLYLFDKYVNRLTLESYLDSHISEYAGADGIVVKYYISENSKLESYGLEDKDLDNILILMRNKLI